MHSVYRLAVIALTLLTACSSNAATPIPSLPTALPTVPSSLPGSNAKPDPQPAVDAAVQDAAGHLGVSPSQLHVDQVEPRQWPDASLGCPQPGQLYSQIVTPGFLILISMGSKQLEYHTDGRANVKLCKES